MEIEPYGDRVKLPQRAVVDVFQRNAEKRPAKEENYAHSLIIG